jgi:hypothetical protein
VTVTNRKRCNSWCTENPPPYQPTESNQPTY